MKPQIAVLICSIIALSLLSSTSNAQNKVKVTLTSKNLVYNNSVGNEWSTSARINDESIYTNRPIQLNLDSDSRLVIKASASESDKYSDYGSKTVRIKFSELNKNEPTYLTVSVRVREDRGRYAGNTAKWEFRFKIEII